jgi:hypothetical protein
MSWYADSKALRQTGRTTRMISQAMAMHAAGLKVYVITHASAYAKVLRKQFPALPESVWMGSFAELGNFDPETHRLVGAHPNCVVLIDHAAIEQRYGALLEELHRYD